MRTSTLLLLAIHCSLPFSAAQASEQDFVPRAGNSAILVESTTVDGIPGANILECVYDVATKKAGACHALGARKFYSRAEIDWILPRMEEAKQNAVHNAWAFGGIAGALVGFMLALVIAAITAAVVAVSGGSALLLIGAGVGITGGAGTTAYVAGKHTQKSHSEMQQNISNGLVKDQKLTMNFETYRYTRSTLKELLAELDR